MFNEGFGAPMVGHSFKKKSNPPPLPIILYIQGVVGHNNIIDRCIMPAYSA
jgi:hypothetical protein